jgi:HNH endonuclease
MHDTGYPPYCLDKEFIMHQVFQRWKLISGHEIQYLVCDRGFIFSFVKNGFLDPSPNQYGYYAVTLWQNGRSHQIRVHQVVAAAFLGPCPEGMEVNHKDGNKLDPKRGRS